MNELWGWPTGSADAESASVSRELPSAETPSESPPVDHTELVDDGELDDARLIGESTDAGVDDGELIVAHPDHFDMGTEIDDGELPDSSDVDRVQAAREAVTAAFDSAPKTPTPLVDGSADPPSDVADAKAALVDRVTAGDQVGGSPIERADLWHEQGDNDLDYQGTCGLASTAAVLRDCGVDTSENEIVQIADSTGRCVNSHEKQELNGGVWGGNDLAVLISERGVDARTTHPATADDLAHLVEQGHGVLAEVSAAPLWDASGGPNHEPSFTADFGYAADHVVFVTGTVRDHEGRLTDFVVNDTGRPDGAAVQVPLDGFETAWDNDRDHEVVVTVSPTATERIGR